jgi:glycosyltransferase involved in cell wall biosynthesis
MALDNFDERIKFATFGGYLKADTIKKYHLENKILEMGWIDYDEDYKKLGIVDVFVLIKEINQINIAGWPNKLGDYLACGKSVLLNPYGDICEFVNSKEDIFFIVKRDFDDIVRVINKIKTGEVLIDGNAENILNFANEHSWIKKAKEIELFYKQVHENEGT